MFSFLSRDARRPGQFEGIGHTVEILGHLQIGIIDDIVNAAGTAVPERSDAGRGQIIGVNVIGEGIIRIIQGRQAAFQTVQRQTVGGIDARGAQDGNGHPRASAPSAQPAFRIYAATRACAFGIRASHFVDSCAATITVNPCRTYVNEPPW